MTILLPKNVLATILLYMGFWSTIISETTFVNTTKQDDGQRNNSTVSQQITTATTTLLNGTKEYSVIRSAKPSIKPTTDDKIKNRTSATKPDNENTLEVQTPTLRNFQQRHHKGNHFIWPTVIIVLAVCLSAVGVGAAVYFVRWKRIKKMKKGFQEEMATICIHDELASEALYSSWKPFMDTNDSNRIKLVFDSANGNTQSSQTNSRALELI
ncbi:uncharacterized protein [Montipora foliosa]|uniref:uncharacterized protein n=1 Tax=Montipora foliosa TaxID=591990 RepID=UPI0035F19551